MTGAFKDHFSGVAAGYRAFRPGYPAALFAWLASIAPRRERAVDLGCGTGQASVALADHFEEVVGLDGSAQQIAQAEPHPRVAYRVAPAEATALPDASADLVLAAQAFHWMDVPRLELELRRVARPGAPFAAVAYGFCRVEPAVDVVVRRLYQEVVGPYWPPERAHVDAGYRTMPFPWPELPAPAFAMQEPWTLERLVGYFRTWSAVSAFQRATGQDPLGVVDEALRAAWGPPERERVVTWDVAVRAGRIRP